jgi:acyl dehydratase
MGLYFEDFTVGQRFETGSVTVSEAEIIDFPRQF